MSLGELFPESLRRRFAEENIEVGKALLIKIEHFKINYPKYIILVAQDITEQLVAYVIINTEINKNVFPTPYLRSLHVRINQEKHDFLDYDSFVNCSELRTFNRQELIGFLMEKPERALGKVDGKILKKIISTLSSAKTIPLYLKQQFGL